MNPWTIERVDTEATNPKTGFPEMSIVTVLRYEGDEVMRERGMMKRDTLESLCNQYNRSGKVWTKPKVCLADLPKGQRETAMKKMKDSTDGFPNLMLDPEENRKARKLYIGDKSE